ncbi:MAG: hypothetical protein Q8L66_04795 [Caulobacter sp.]|nr:hypothetical protein [Caulobacter sp.]
MELRRASGTRLSPEPPPLTLVRSPAYRAAHACFGCRLSFKLICDPTLEPDVEHRCPGCGGALHRMGRNFAAPKKTNRDQWRKVEILWKAGFRFDSFRSFPDAEPLPATLGEVEDFVRRNPDHPLRKGVPRGG